MVLPLDPTDVPGVYRRGSRFVVVYRVDGRQRKQSAGTMADARAIKVQRDGEARGASDQGSLRRRILVPPPSAPD